MSIRTRASASTQWTALRCRITPRAEMTASAARKKKSQTGIAYFAPDATTTKAVTTRLASPSGTSPFHPRRMNWS